MKIKNIVKTLRQNNYKVKSSHFRNAVLVGDKNSMLFRITKVNKHEFDDILSKGGETKLEITTPDGENYEGNAVCSPLDGYDKKLGISIAFDRIMEKWKQEGKTIKLNNVEFV
jgi:hypothetical protein